MICSWIVLTLAVMLIGWLAFRCRARNKPLDFKGKSVLITGGSSGIGECIAYIFSELGAFVTIASNQPADVLLL